MVWGLGFRIIEFRKPFRSFSTPVIYNLNQGLVVQNKVFLAFMPRYLVGVSSIFRKKSGLL